MILAVVALTGTLVLTVQTLLVLIFVLRRTAPARAGFSSVSILKPVCGLDDELEENLLSFTRIRGLRYEVIISAEDEGDPALEIARSVMRSCPAAPFRIVVDPGSRCGVVNRKVERLIAAARVAVGSILVISDSNVRVEEDALARTLSAFDRKSVGCVSNGFTGAGASTAGAAIEAMHLLGFVLPGAVLAAAGRVPCVVGKSMAIRRTVLDAIGGFERFRSTLAEDQAIGLAVRDAGFDVVLSPVLVRNVIVRRTLRAAIARQVRWNKIRYSFSHVLYVAELLLNPLPFALLAGLHSPAVPLIVLAFRYAQLAVLNRVTRSGLRSSQLALLPLLDLAMLYAWFVPFLSKEVTWRGYRARIGRGTEMIQQAA